MRLGRDLHAEETFFHDISGARLIIARIEGTDARWAVEWIAPWQRTIEVSANYSEKSAREEFLRQRALEPPETPSLCRDWQLTKVYRLEDATLDTSTPELTQDQMKKMARRIADDFNMVAPPLSEKKFRKGTKSPYSCYWPESHRITMASTHKDFSILLHEMAHAIDMKLNGNKWSHHGPSFVATLLFLSERYQPWHNVEEVRKQAILDGILVADAKKLPMMKYLAK